MSEILVTGATGFLGAAIVRQLVDDVRYSPVATARRKTSNLVSGLQPIIVGNLGASTDWSSALSDVEVVIHTAARVHVMDDTANVPLTEYRKVNFEGTMNLARQAVQAGVKRFIFISSIKVNGEETVLGKPFTADDAPNPVDPYGVSKAETEQALLELAASTGLEVVIIRPVLVYGPGVKANFRSLMKWMYKGVPLPLGAVYNQRSLVALDNLVSFIIHCIDHPKAANEIFLISDGEDVSTTELLQKVATAFRKKP
ncbi:MAG: NAD-dependent epimerase/dehydratase family protein, partial [Gammaproteobacteria bacterium]|nr:NAD-dependent epimerase/dehydratase family protein [Gammaproteobacteria bacterium]